MKLRPPIKRLLAQARRRSSMKIAVEGCCHGELDRIYETLGKVQEREGVKVELLICCGDFQAARNDGDLASMAVPPKYRKMNTFYKYYNGEKTAPVLTLFIGGNHEASNHLWELSYGGWVAPNIYYLGNAGVVRYGGLRIAGLSGIYKQHDYGKGHFERPPYNEGTKRSAYHVRSCDVFRLKQLSGHVDIMLSHDWPQGIYHHGNKDKLLQMKPYFADEISRNDLGSPPAMELLQYLRPNYWFSAHLHVKFAAVYPHKGGGVTRFLALDKCLPRRKFLQILDVPTPTGHTPPQLEWDPEWLAILRATQPLMRYTPALWLPPHPLTDERLTFTPTQEELTEIDQLLGSNFAIPSNFTKTVPPYDPSRRINHHAVPVAQENPQTADFCHKLRINNPFSPGAGGQKLLDQRTHYPWLHDSDSSGNEDSLPQSTLLSHPGGLKSGNETKLNPGVTAVNPDEIVLSDSSNGSDPGTAGGIESHAAVSRLNPAEIALSDSEDDSVDQAGELQTSYAPVLEECERSVGKQRPESVLSRVTATGSSAEKEDSSVVLHEQQSQGTGDSGDNSAQGRKPLLLPCPSHPTTSSPPTELGGTRTEPNKDAVVQTMFGYASTGKETDPPPPECTTDGLPAEGGRPLEEPAGSSTAKRPCHGSPDQRPKIKRRNVALYASRDEGSDSD